MFQSLDKDRDGFLTRAEVKGSPHDKDFSTLDKNRDGKLSREEHAAAPEHASDKAASGASTAPAAPAGGTAAPSSSSQPKSKY
jgi:Ca2+-binding EF-hand superfamily protein